MQLLRAKYETERGLRRGDKTHANDKGLPLCRVAYRNLNIVGGGSAETAICQWIPEAGVVPTCAICTAKMRKMGGTA